MKTPSLPRRHVLVGFLSLLGLAVVAMTPDSIAYGQNAASQARGDGHGNYEFEAHRVLTHQTHARDYSQIIYQQGQLKEGLPMTETQEYVGAIKKSVLSANKALDKLAAAHPKDDVAKKHVDKIKKLHQAALAHCEMCDGECKKAEGSKTVIADCCTEMTKNLNEARAETEKLMKHLKIERLPGEKKAAHEDKKDAPEKKKE